MTKHIGPIIAWIILAGIALYVVRNYTNLFDGIIYVNRSVDPERINERFEQFFK